MSAQGAGRRRSTSGEAGALGQGLWPCAVPTASTVNTAMACFPALKTAMVQLPLPLLVKCVKISTKNGLIGLCSLYKIYI